MNQTTTDDHRVAGVLLGMAAGDALGAGYEFHPSVGDDVAIVMEGNHMWEPGEWTDDTAMAVAIAEAAADGDDLRDPHVLDEIARRWREWALTAKDVGSQTSAVLSAASAAEGGLSAATMTAAAEDWHHLSGRSAGNGSLMRTAPVALAYLHDEDALVEAARTISGMTHYDAQAGDACVLWCLAIRHAVLTGELDVRVGLGHVPEERRVAWVERIEVAERSRPQDFSKYSSADGKSNGWVVKGFQGAWSAIATTQSGSAEHLRIALEEAVRGGDDADTVAAIAGGLLGAAYGASAVPASWRRILHGWPQLRSRDLISLALRVAARGEIGDDQWPREARFDYSRYGDVHALAVHPHDPEVVLSGVGHLDPLPHGVAAVVTLCRLGADEVPTGDVEVEDHVEVWLVDSHDPAANPHLDFVLADTVAVVRQLRVEGKRVLVHCVQGQNRTPTIGALYAMSVGGVTADEAVADMQKLLPGSLQNAAFREAITRVEGNSMA